MSDSDLLRFLEKSKILAGFSEKELETVSTYGHIEKHEPNRILIQEGETGKALYIILKGQVEVFLPKKSDYSKVERAKKVGQAVAELAVEKGIKKVVFDRNRFRYQGRIKAVAEGAREKGLEL